jgi:hypothetical protein
MQNLLLSHSITDLQEGADKVKRLAPSIGGGARFIPEKYKQSIVKIYTLIFQKSLAFPA